MTKYFAVIFTVISFAGAAEPDSAFNKIMNDFKSFRYESVIHKTNALLQSETVLEKSRTLELYRVKAVSHYSLGQEDSARAAFIRILKIDPGFSPDPVNNSPKIIDFFNRIKSDLPAITETPEKNDKQEMSRQTEMRRSGPAMKPFRSVFIRSLVFPGWGHYYLEQKKKGTLLGVANIAALAPVIYYSLQTAEKEKDYLNEIDPEKIKSAYDDYNAVYKIRNICIGIYAVLWLYTQIDISSMALTPEVQSQAITIQPVIDSQNYTGVQLIYTF